jgi:hypothetical protein
MVYALYWCIWVSYRRANYWSTCILAFLPECTYSAVFIMDPGGSSGFGPAGTFFSILYLKTNTPFPQQPEIDKKWPTACVIRKLSVFNLRPFRGIIIVCGLYNIGPLQVPDYPGNCPLQRLIGYKNGNRILGRYLSTIIYILFVQ